MSKKKTAAVKAEQETQEAQTPQASQGRGDGWAKCTEAYDIPVVYARFWWRNQYFNMVTITKEKLEWLASQPLFQGVILKKSKAAKED
jgi:hypothetical protein